MVKVKVFKELKRRGEANVPGKPNTPSIRSTFGKGKDGRRLLVTRLKEGHVCKERLSIPEWSRHPRLCKPRTGDKKIVSGSMAEMTAQNQLLADESGERFIEEQELLIITKNSGTNPL